MFKHMHVIKQFLKIKGKAICWSVGILVLGLGNDFSSFLYIINKISKKKKRKKEGQARMKDDTVIRT